MSIMSEMKQHQNDYTVILDNKPVLIGDLFVSELIQKYGTFSFLRMYQDEDVTDYQYFYSIFTAFKDNNAAQFEKYFDAIHAAYSPMDNYRRTESTEYKKELTHGKTSTNMANNYTSTTTYGSDVTDKITTFDDAVFRNGSQTDKGGVDTNVLSGSMTTSNSGTDTELRHAADNIISVTGTNGNIADLIKSELDLRSLRDTEDFIIDQFVTQYLFISME